MKSKIGDSFVYIFRERSSSENAFFKIGFASHNKTDEAIKAWKKYQNNEIPVTIVRRISDLQTGNPRKITAFSVFKFTGKECARNAETILHNCFKDKSCTIPEWFDLSAEDIEKCIKIAVELEGYVEHAVFGKP